MGSTWLAWSSSCLSLNPADSYSRVENIIAHRSRLRLNRPDLMRGVTVYFLSSVLSLGVPEGQGRRAHAWRLLLNYLPSKRSEWDKVLGQQRLLYHQLLGGKLHQPSLGYVTVNIAGFREPYIYIYAQLQKPAYPTSRLLAILGYDIMTFEILVRDYAKHIMGKAQMCKR